jgi:FkbM family methyltransferase
MAADSGMVTVGTSFALDELDRKVARRLPARGVFVEAGAHDGLTQSNTALLEFSRGWCGLLVEPIPELARRCRAHRPGSVVEQVALVAADFPGDHIRMTYCNRSSIVEGGRGGPAADRDWVERCRRLPGQDDLEPYPVVVPARTLSSLLDDHGLSKVDFLSLDLEGYEANALRGLDLERHRPTLMLVEVSRDREAIDAILAPWYVEVAELSDHRSHDPPWYDVLYRARRPGSPSWPSGLPRQN